MQVETVTYDVNWQAFRRGMSIFIPCLDPPRAKQAITDVTKRLRIRTVMKVVIEDGIRGIRVWRT